MAAQRAVPSETQTTLLNSLGAIQKEQVTMDAPREEQSLVSLPMRRVIDASGGTRLA